MSLSDQVLTDLRAQRRLLLGEFDAWRRRAEAAGDLAQHQSQVRRTTATLEGVLAEALKGGPLRVDGPGSDRLELDDIPPLRRALGTVHLLWDFFRDKFAQRDTGLFTSHLGAADDLAWSCYRPFVERAVALAEDEADLVAQPTASIRPEQLKEPPLLFYSPDRGPFAQARASAFRPPGLSAKDVDLFRRALLNLPVPIIGFPWPQARSVPALVFVGHEVGHVVAEDLGLAGELDGLIAGLGLPDERTGVWQAWSDEAFADVFGVAALGGAYVERLVRLLATDLSSVRGERIDRDRPGAYATSSLRVELCRATQDLLGLPPESLWRSTFGSPAGDSAAYADDAGKVAETLLNGPYTALGGRGLDSVLRWSRADDARAAEVAGKALADEDADTPFEVRTWIAAAVRAQATDPARYEKRDLDLVFARYVVDERGAVVRSAEAAAVRSRAAAFDRRRGPAGAGPSIEQLDRAAGSRLATALGL